jgi:parvulin-like peptidyl-prolyl isomerase
MGFHMKKQIFIILLGVCLLWNCGKKQELFKLKEGTPAYQLALNISKIIPELDPTKDKVVATTKYFNITAAEVINALQENFGKQTEQLLKLSDQELKKVIMDNTRGLTEKKLVLLAATNAGITVKQSELDSLIKLHFTRYGGEERYKLLLMQNNIDLEFVKSDLRNSLLIQHYFEDKIISTIQIAEQDILDTYQKDFMQDRYATVRHILLSTEGKSEAEKVAVHEKMESIRQRAIHGEDFAKLAREYTEDQGSKANGGLYKNFERGDMVKAFDEASFTVPIGEISDIIETEFGYHIIKVIDRKKVGKSLDELRPQIIKKLQQQREESTIKNHIENLVTEAEYKQIDL